MALSAYPDCEGFPQIDIFTYQGYGAWGEYWAELAEEHLGCDPELFTVAPHDFDQLVRATSSDEFPNAWTLGWGVDYPDPHDWLHPMFSCDGDNMVRRPCSQADTLMEMAATELDPHRRAQLYAAIEDAFFGEGGEYPIAPIYARAFNFFARSWYTGPYETDGIYGGQHWDAYTIDMEAKLAAREP
jgi:ABC-type oligopeptide transport system substrate-binding subunit